MLYRNHPIGTALRLLTLLCLPLLLHAQAFTGEPRNFVSKELDRHFIAYEVFRIDAASLTTYVRNHATSAPAELHLGDHHWKLDLVPSTVVAPNCPVQVVTDKGVETHYDNEQKAFMGWELNANGRVRLTLDEDDFIYGFVETTAETWYIEPLRYLADGAAPDEFIVYRAADVIPIKGRTCGVEETAEMLERYEKAKTGHEGGQAESMMACYRLELAIASDFSMFQKYGSVNNVQNHNVAVINNVQGNYTGVFTHDIQYQIVTQFVVSISGGDPWSSTLDAGDLLDSFSSWGNGGGFNTNHDLGELWTNRDFAGTTVGIAWLDGLCQNFWKYHCLQDFTSNANSLRVMTAHEIGHNLSLVHDSGGGFIMSPSVNNTNTWSTLSINTVNGYLPPFIANGCLSLCPGTTPPTADFTINPTPACSGQTVTFTDASTGGVTSRTWNFTGTTPATATTSTVTRIFPNAGTYNVTLTVNGPGGTASTTQQVVIQPAVVANFTAAINGYTVTITNTTTGADTYSWNMGDGTTLNEISPVYTYATGGTYTIVLTATGPCGTSTKQVTVNTAPTASFAFTPAQPCAGQPITLNNTSSANATTHNWTFPGGTPVSSNLKNPTVTYSTPGTYTITLTTFNNAGSSTFSQMVTVSAPPSAAFTSTINGLTASFTSSATNAATYSWAFGNGNSSAQANPTHTYATGGTYTVTLTVGNVCGISTSTSTITLNAAPTAAFTASPASGCGPLTVQFTNTSTGSGNTYAWAFPGGTPATSTAANPSVVYNTPGTYSVTLTATNALGANTATQTNLVTVSGPPVTAFTAATNAATVTFANTTTGATGYSWAFGDGNTSTQTNPTHTYAAGGNYTVTLTATNACGTTTATQSVTAVTPPTASFTATNTTGCAPLTVQYTSTSSANATSFNWSFPGGTPATSTAQNPSVVYNAPGTYSVTLTVGNAAGTATATQTSFVTVNGGPSASFTNTVNGPTATFTNTSGNATSYSWNFGDGGTSTATSPSHTYIVGGTYTVTLTATNACGTTSATQTLTVVTPPTASFTATNNTGCNPLTVQFTSTSSANATGYSWQFPGGNPATSTAQNPTVTYATAGTYSVTLTVSNSAGTASATQANFVSVGVGPAPSFTNTVNGATATFSNTSSGATSYSWNFGDGGTSTAANPSHTYAVDGTYTVTLTATNACGTATATQTVTIVTPPQAAFIANNTQGCAPLGVIFTNTSSANATTFNWSFPGGTPATSTEEHPTVVYSTPGTYTATLVAGNAAGTSTVSTTNPILVTGPPAAAFTNALAGTTATFTNTSTGATSYSWSFGDGGTSTATNPSHAYTTDGVYTVVLSATNFCGTTTSTATVTIVTPPTAGFAASNTTGCGPLTVQFNNTSSANATAYSWQFPGGTPATSTAANPTVTYANPGTYAVTLTVSNSAGSSTTSQAAYVNVLENPAGAFSAAVNGAVASFTNTSQNATGYSWAFGDGNTSTATNPTHTYTTDGTYTVTLTATNDCGSSTATQTVTITTPPKAAFLPSQTQGCAPMTVSFDNASSANATTFTWTFEDGTPATSTDENPTASWSTPGDYVVTLIASNAAGADTTSSVITVQGPPSAGFDLTLAGLSVVLSNTSTGATGYLWNFGDGATSTEAEPTHTYAAVGSYIITLQATNACGDATFTQTLEITGSAPLPQFQAAASGGGEAVGCAPFTVQFTDQSVGNPTSWQWEFPGGTPSTSTQQNPVVTYNGPGTYGVSLTAGNIYGTNATSQDSVVVVNVAPAPGFTFTQSGGTVTFTNLTADATGVSWNFGDGSGSDETNPTHTYAANGPYTVVLTAENACGTTSISQLVQITTVGAEEPGWLQRFRVFPNPNHGVFTVELTGEPAPDVEFTLFNALGQVIVRENTDFRAGSLTYTVRQSNLPAAVYTLRVRTGERVVYRQVAVE